MGVPKKNTKNQRRKLNKRKKKGLIKMESSVINEPSTEDLILNAKEHKILKNYAKRLQERFSVKIHIPNTTSALDSDNFFVSIEGLDSNREFVKAFLSEKMKELDPKSNPSKDYDVVNDCPVDVVTLSDSESEAGDISVIVDSGHHNKRNWYGDAFSSSSQNTAGQPKRNRKRKADNLQLNSQKVSSSQASDIDEVTSSTDDDKVVKKMKLSDSVLIVEENGSSCLSPDFIPLISGTESNCKRNNESVNKISCSNSSNSSGVIDDSIIIIEEPQSSTTPRRLRPIVIDGSNVAMSHGKTSHTFSAKGIKLAIDYFLNRGHTQVTAFVPQYRKNRNPNRSIPTTDIDILEELEAKQQVVYTPSRRVNGRYINSYDDRFIVQLAASNGGVIVSNDNYRDLLDEKESFKEAIEQRLLMFCFVGDIFMVPDDPLGRSGPRLDDFLSFPPEDHPKTEEKNIN